MKKILLLIILMGNILVCFAQRPPLHMSVSESAALQAVQAYYPESNNDYYVGIFSAFPDPDTIPTVPVIPRLGGDADANYVLNNLIVNGDWIIAVDENPMKGAGHSLSYYCVPRRQLSLLPVSAFSVDPSIIHHANFTSVYASNRYGDQAMLKPQVVASGANNSLASHTYVVMMNGVGYNVENYERYWNDCSYMYQVLRNRYGVPKANFSILISDGEIAGADMMKADGSGFVSSSTDLDGDGEADYTLGALRSNLQTIFSNLSNTLTPNDHLFLFFTGCGGYDEVRGDSYIKFWKSDSLYSSELNTMLSSFNVKDINILLGQNSAGGFISNLQQEGRVITAACQQDSCTWSCPDIPFNEAIYHWTSAVNEKDVWDNTITADTNNDGVVAATEAFNYAQQNIIQGHSLLLQTPASILSNTLGFGVPGYCLMIRDNYADTGDEPNMTTTNYCMSPDVLVDELSNIYGGVSFFPTPPEYGEQYSPESAIFDVVVKNVGSKTYPGGVSYLHSLILSDGFIHYLEMQTPPIKQELDTMRIDKTLLPGDTAVLKVRWYPPTSFTLYFDEYNHHCSELYAYIVAKVCDSETENGFGDYSLNNVCQYSMNYRNVACRYFFARSRLSTGINSKSQSIVKIIADNNSFLRVTFENPLSANELILVKSIFDGSVRKVQVPCNERNEITIPEALGKSGMYAISLIDNEGVVDTKQILVK